MVGRSRIAFAFLLAPLLLGGEYRRPAPVRVDEAPLFSPDGWVEYVPGDAPLVLLAPHGGSRRPDEVRDRRDGVRLADSRTLELARELSDAFHVRTGKRPHLVVCHLHRIKLDANRDQGEAALGDAASLAAWRAWHAFVDRAKRALAAEHGGGLLIDLHGHSHPEAWIEWGYALSAHHLARDDGALAVGTLAAATSIDALVRRHGGDRARILRGPRSLGALTQAAGYASVPSPTYPHPDGGSYFDGGYNTRRHGSREGGEVDAVQLEVPRHLRMDPVRRRRFARDAARCVTTYLEHWYGFEPAEIEADGDD